MDFVDRDKVEAPTWLQERADQWGEEWEQRQRAGKEFSWRQHRGHGYEDLLERVSTMTEHHCSYCDAYPMGSRVKSTIDHFRPKSVFPKIAYRWDNLFLACSLCQERQNRFDDKLLKPDVDGYRFEDYFTIDWATGRLEPVGREGEERYERASMTIELFHLNGNGKPQDRLSELDTYEGYQGDRPFDVWAYRFFLRLATRPRSDTPATS